MVISKWSKNGDTAEIVESPVKHFVAWNVERGKYAVETETGRVYFDSIAEVEDTLREEGWSQEEINAK